MNTFNRISINSSKCISDLCVFGTEFQTDKSPYSSHAGALGHRHPYTAVYDLLFSSRRYEPLLFGELGILENKSMRMWRNYFTQATLFGFDAFQDKIDSAKIDGLPNTHYALADVRSRSSLSTAFNSAGRLFDIIIDDSTHMFDDQIRFLSVAVEFVKPGGFLVVEDVFKEWDENRYRNSLSLLCRFFSSVLFIECNHDESFSEGGSEPYYNNDKLLVLVRNETHYHRTAPARELNLEIIRNRNLGSYLYNADDIKPDPGVAVTS